MNKKYRRQSVICQLSKSNFIYAVNRLLYSLIYISVISWSAEAAPTSVDPTFGSGGKVVSSPDGSEATFGQDYALLPDGKIIAAGGGSTFGMMVVRYNANGSLDTTFGANGIGSITFDGQTVSATAVDVQPDGKIVVGGKVGRFENNRWSYDFAVGRLNPNGSVDTTFGTNGKATVSFVPEIYPSPYAIEEFSSLKIAPDGKIIVGGSAGNPGPGGNSQFVFARFNADGALDMTFDGDGRVIGVTSYIYLNDMAVLPDGSFVAVGSSAFNNFCIAYKYNAAGGLVGEFQLVSPNLRYGGLYGIAAQPDGKMIVVGKHADRIAAFRLNANGSQDTSFAAPFTPYGKAVSVAIQPDGKIVANYTTAANLNDFSNSFNVVSYNSDGTLDSTFGSGGFLTATANSGGTDYGRRILSQPDGKILVGGYSSLSNPTKYFFSMIRFSRNSATVRRPLFDYDGDGKSDVSVFRPSENKWFVLKSSDSTVSQPVFGASGDVPVPADFDGDDKTDLAVFRPSTGVFWYAASSQNNAFRAVQWGEAGDVPRPSDFDGDGKTDFVLYRPSNNTWYRLGSTGITSNVAFGAAGDKPLVGDFDGDGKSDAAIYRPSTSVWWYAASASAGAHRAVQFGLSSDVPVAADYDGDGKTDFAVYRPSTGVWHILKSADQSYFSYQFGTSEDKPVAADYDGDGKSDIGVFRPSNGNWYLMRSTAGFSGVQWGASTDVPTPNSFIP